MKLKKMARALQVVLALVGVVSAVAYIGFVPALLGDMAQAFPEFAYLERPSLILLSLTALPLLVVLGTLWQVCGSLAQGEVFTGVNAARFRLIGGCAAGCTLYLLAFSVFLFVVGAANPGTMLAFFAVFVAGAGIALAAFLLGRILVQHAPAPQAPR